MASRGMGRGLAAILSSGTTTPGADEPDLREVPVDLITPNPHQPRRVFDQDALVALGESVRERGVLQPVLLRPVTGGTYELVAGERRWRAARLAGLDTVPALVRPHADADAIEVALIENMAREDLNPVEEARACAVLAEDLGLTREEIGRRVGRSRVAISNLLRLLDLPDEALDALERGALTEGHGRALLMAPDHADRRRLARAAADGGWSVRETERRARATADPQAVRPRAARPRGLHPDEEEAVTRLSEALTSSLGADVRIAPRAGGYQVSLGFGSLAEAEALAERLSALGALADGAEPSPAAARLRPV